MDDSKIPDGFTKLTWAEYWIRELRHVEEMHLVDLNPRDVGEIADLIEELIR